MLPVRWAFSSLPIIAARKINGEARANVSTKMSRKWGFPEEKLFFRVSVGRTFFALSNFHSRFYLTIWLWAQDFDRVTVDEGAPDCKSVICEPAGVKQAISSFFLVGRYDKALNYWSRRKQQVMFPLGLNVSPSFVSGNKTHHSLGASINCIRLSEIKWR